MNVTTRELDLSDGHVCMISFNPLNNGKILELLCLQIWTVVFPLGSLFPPPLTPRDLSLYLIRTQCPSLFSKFSSLQITPPLTCTTIFQFSHLFPLPMPNTTGAHYPDSFPSFIAGKKVKTSCLLRPVNSQGPNTAESSYNLYLNGHQILKGHYSKSFVTLFKPRIPFSFFPLKKILTNDLASLLKWELFEVEFHRSLSSLTYHTPSTPNLLLLVSLTGNSLKSFSFFL